MTIPSGYGQANIRFGGAGFPNGAEVVLGFGPTIGTPDPAVVAGFIGGTWVTEMLGVQCNTTTLEEVLVKLGPDATGPSGTFGFNDPGLLTADQAPPNVAGLVLKSTALGGRAGRGRMYVPGIPEAQITSDGTLDSTYRTNLQDAVDAFAAALAVGEVFLVILHGAGAPITTPTEVTSLSVSAKVATQRRRLRR